VSNLMRGNHTSKIKCSKVLHTVSTNKGTNYTKSGSPNRTLCHQQQHTKMTPNM
jgi:hypothetical protein